jgi:hypothetical protein
MSKSSFFLEAEELLLLSVIAVWKVIDIPCMHAKPEL